MKILKKTASFYFKSVESVFKFPSKKTVYSLFLYGRTICPTKCKKILKRPVILSFCLEKQDSASNNALLGIGLSLECWPGRLEKPYQDF